MNNMQNVRYVVFPVFGLKLEGIDFLRLEEVVFKRNGYLIDTSGIKNDLDKMVYELIKKLNIDVIAEIEVKNSDSNANIDDLSSYIREKVIKAIDILRLQIPFVECSIRYERINAVRYFPCYRKRNRLLVRIGLAKSAISEKVSVFKLDADRKPVEFTAEISPMSGTFELELDEELKRRLQEGSLSDLVSTVFKREPNMIELKVSNALRWFSSGIDDARPADAFVKHFIALEGLLSFSSDGYWGITNRLSSRVSTLFDNNGDIRQRIESLYRIRGDIVHRGLQEINLGDLIELERRVAESIMKFTSLMRKEGWREEKDAVNWFK